MSFCIWCDKTEPYPSAWKIFCTADDGQHTLCFECEERDGTNRVGVIRKKLPGRCLATITENDLILIALAT